MTFGEYLQKWALDYEINQRPGQWAFNLLDKVKPKLAKKVIGTELDPFHNDRLMAAFFDFVNEHWEDV